MGNQSLTFDRTADVSKLDGCNTRGLEYRWDIFKRHLPNVPQGSEVLDFGAGSLRESFDLVSRGFDVTSIDLDLDTLHAYKEKYAWPADTHHRLIATPDLFGALTKLEGQKFFLITCFDVLEHLEDPTSALRELSAHLNDSGLLFVTVPNGRTLFEIAWRIDLTLAKATGRYMKPGEPHLQRNSPTKWKAIINKAGLAVVDHEMHIGFFANSCAAVLQVPLALSARIARKLGAGFDGVGLAERATKRIAPTMDFLDQHTRSLRGLYGWNLFVISKVK